jgi:hypothetical protein
MRSIFKKLFVPSGEKTLVAYESWVVRWESVYSINQDSRIAYTKHECEIFPSKDDAIAFANALENAANIMKDGSRLIKVIYNESKLATVYED